MMSNRKYVVPFILTCVAIAWQSVGSASGINDDSNITIGQRFFLMKSDIAAAPKYSFPDVSECVAQAPGATKDDPTIHVLVLMHGIMGSHKELQYLKQGFLMAHAKREDEIVVVHAATSNDGITLDGVEAGGTRLANEINALVEHVQASCSQEYSISLSVVGFSLGGIYARYALSKIQWEYANESDKPVTVHKRLFATIASPHLGIQNHTYMAVPRQMESIGAKSMKATGDDLFRYTPMMEELTFNDTFIGPLSQFSKRIAFANAFGTDYPVPTATAAFWSDTDSKQTLTKTAVKVAKEEGSEEDAVHLSTVRFATERKTIIKTTKARTSEEGDASYNGDTSDEESLEVERKMSIQLDALGWTKIAIDLRPHLPKVGWSMKNETPLTLQETLDQQQHDDDTFTARTLQDLLGKADPDHKVMPIGHSFLVASAKTKFYDWFYQKGRPIASIIASELLEEMLN